MIKLIKTLFILIGLKIRNLIKKPQVIKRNGKEYVNINQILKNSNRKQRRALIAWAKRNPQKIIHL